MCPPPRSSERPWIRFGFACNSSFGTEATFLAELSLLASSSAFVIGVWRISSGATIGRWPFCPANASVDVGDDVRVEAGQNRDMDECEEVPIASGNSWNWHNYYVIRCLCWLFTLFSSECGWRMREEVVIVIIRPINPHIPNPRTNGMG